MYLKPNRQQQGTKVVTTPLTQLTGVAENSISQQKPKPVLPHRSREYHELFKMIQRLSLFADLHIDGVWLTSLPEVETQAYKLLERVTDIHEIWYERYVTRDHPNVFVQSVKSVITTWTHEFVRYKNGQLRERGRSSIYHPNKDFEKKKWK